MLQSTLTTTKTPSLALLRALRISLRPPPPSRQQRHLLRRPPQRSLTTYSTPGGRLRQLLSTARRDHPVLLPFLTVSAVATLTLLGLLIYHDRTHIAPQYAAYPAPVEQQLRLALHFTHVSPDPDAAADRFKRAVEMAEVCGMDAVGREVVGIRVRYAECLEGFGRVEGAVGVLRGVVGDCEERVAELDRGRLLRGRGGGEGVGEAEAEGEVRQALLRGIVQAKAKMAQLYESDYLQDLAMAKKTLSDAVQLLVSETPDPQSRGFSAENRAGLSLEEIAALLLQMGDLYATSGEEANAVQVYMLTLDPLRKACGGNASCKEVQVLANIASSMALAMDKPGAKVNGVPVNEQNVRMARKAALKWADKAVDVAGVVEAGDRDEICVLGLASAQMTKAELLVRDGRGAEAKELWRSVLPVLRENGLSGLVRVAEDGLGKVDG